MSGKVCNIRYCFVIFLTFMLWRLPAIAQSPDFLPSAVSIAGVSSPVTSRWSAFGNPASMIQTTPWQFAVQYENRYMLRQFNNVTAQAAYCNKYVNVGLCVTRFGYKHYGEIVVGLAFAHNFADKFSLGLQANYYAAYMGAEEGYRGTVLPQIGFTVAAGKHVTIGFQTFNPFMQHVKARSGAKKQLPSIYTLGVDYRFYRGFSWLTELQKNLRGDWRVATGVEWQAIEMLRVKLGMHADRYFVGCLGVGMTFKGFGFDINAELHPILGVCLQGNIHYAF